MREYLVPVVTFPAFFNPKEENFRLDASKSFGTYDFVKAGTV